MSFAQQYEQDLAMGCVCDFDVPCPTHKGGRWSEPTKTGDCIEFGHLFQWYNEGPDGVPVLFDVNDCVSCGKTRKWIEITFGEGPVEPDPVKPQTHAAYKREWIADFRNETGANAFEARLAFERMLNQSWDGCQCPTHGGAAY